ncbi:MAG: hypothetical protein KAJ12_13625 [Bacteroidetes bacterium]|nr:hypothetical protein [Bacteroidota bacterium]
MTRVEQHKMITELRDYESKMNRYDQDDFDMLVKRDKDDEDLDTIAERKLIELYEKYVPQRGRIR